MSVPPLALPGYSAPTPIDWSPLDQLGKTLEANKLKSEYGRIGRGIADGSIDYRQAAGSLADLGNPDAMLKFLALAEAKDKLAREQAASNQFASSLGGMFGGASQPTITPTSPVSGPTVPNDSNALPGQVGMNMRLADLSQDFIQDHLGTSISSGARTPQQQATLYANRANNPNPVAAPGTSHHETGNAVDIAGMTPEDRAQLSQYALSQPVANDPPHVELAPGQQPYQVAGPTVAAPQSPAQAVQPSPANGFQGLNATHVPMLLQAMANPNLPAAQKDMAKTLLTRALDESKTPDKIKMLQQLKQQSGYQGSILDLEKELRAAGKAEINIDQKAETAEAKAAGEAAGKRRADMFAAAGAAGKTLTNLSRMESLLNQMSQGKIEPARLNISAWAKSMGLNDDVARSIGLDPSAVGSAQAVQSLVNESVLGKIGPGGFPANNFSDADRQFITQIFPSLGDDPRANKIRIESARRMANLDVERAKAYQAFKRDPKNKGLGFEDFELNWADKMSSRDMFGDLRREAESIVGAPRNDIGGTLNNPGAAQARQPRGASGSWGGPPPTQVASPDDARRLPPGTRFVTPDGREFVR
jgi:hypothetical protein